MKNDCTFYIGKPHLSGSVKNSGGCENLLRLIMKSSVQFLKGNTKHSPPSFAFLRLRKLGHFILLFYLEGLMYAHVQVLFFLILSCVWCGPPTSLHSKSNSLNASVDVFAFFSRLFCLLFTVFACLFSSVLSLFSDCIIHS